MEIKYLFDCIGETEDVDVLKRKGDTAFIHYIYAADAREAVEQMNNSCPLYCKRPINVEMAEKSRLGQGNQKSNICWLYNQRTCQLGMACSRQHVCLFCNGNHPRKQCTEVDIHFRKLRSDQIPYHNNNRGGNTHNHHHNNHHSHHNHHNNNGMGGGHNYGHNNHSHNYNGNNNSFRPPEFEVTIDDIPINAANERDLRLLFNSSGPITRIKIMKPRKRNMKVRAYMEFADMHSVNNALKLNGTIWRGDTISVRKSSNNYRGGNRYRNNNNNNNNNNNDRYRNNDRYNNNNNNNNNHNSNDASNRERFGEYMNSERMNMVNNMNSSNKYKHNNMRSPSSQSVSSATNTLDSSISLTRHKSTKHHKSKHLDIGGCISRGGEGKIIIKRKYRLKEVCHLFNAVTGCYSKDCEQIHVCSLCECEDHALPKCPRNGTKIGDILMKQIEQDSKKPGSALLKIELNAKAKKRSHDKHDKYDKHDKDNKDGQPPKKKIKLSSDNNNNNNNDTKNNLKPRRISQLRDIQEHYLFFCLDGSVWRRVRTVSVNQDEDKIKLHYLGWDSKFDETVSLKNVSNAKRLSIYKPDGFYSEATITPQVRQALLNVNSQKDVKLLQIELVKKHLKSCQLKNEGPDELLRERLLNVTDEIKIMDAKTPNDVIEINMRRIDEEYFIKYPERINSEKDTLISNEGNDNTQLCQDYNSNRGCNNSDCSLIHECLLCGSKKHINLDCPNHQLL